MQSSSPHPYVYHNRISSASSRDCGTIESSWQHGITGCWDDGLSQAGKDPRGSQLRHPKIPSLHPGPPAGTAPEERAPLPKPRPLSPKPRPLLKPRPHLQNHAHYPPTNHARSRRKATPISLKPRPLHFPQRRCCSHAHLRGFCAGAVRAGRAGQRAGPRWRRRGRRAGGRAERRRRRTGGERGPPRAARPGPARRHGPPRRLLRAGGLRRGKAR